MEREDAWPWAGDREAHAADAGRTTLQTQGSLPSPAAALGSGLPLETGLLPSGRPSICPKELRPHCGQDQSVTSKPGQLTNACRQTPDLLELFPDVNFLPFSHASNKCIYGQCWQEPPCQMNMTFGSFIPSLSDLLKSGLTDGVAKVIFFKKKY